VAVPVTAPGTIEQILSANGGTVTRTKTEVRALMATAAEGRGSMMLAADSDGGFIFPDFHPAFDALFSFAKLLEMLALQDVSLGAARAAVPEYHLASETVSCPWEIKGRIMRELMLETDEANAELLDGIKVHHNDGAWTLILPDASEPLFRVYAEAGTQDKANELVHRSVLRISALKRG